MNTFSTFFQENPNKILGVEKPGTTQYGKPIIIISGNLENLSNIDVSPSLEPQVKDLMEVVDFNEENIKKSLSSYKDEKSKKTAPKKVSKSKSKLYIDEIPAPNYELLTGKAAFDFLNADIEKEDVEVWVYYCEANNRPVHPFLLQNYKVAYTENWFSSRMSSGHLCYDFISKTYIPRVIYYSGNIYEKIKFTESYAINKTYAKEFESQLNVQLQKLKEIKPKPLLLTGPVEERLMLDPTGNFCLTFEITYEGELTTITSAFKKFLREIDSSEQLTDISIWQLINIQIDGDRFSNGTSKEEKDIFKRKALQEIRYFMPKFLENLDQSERERIESVWNYENNSFVDANYNQVPIMFELNRIFKDAPLVIRPEQREGVAFQEINGTGVCGYDVGVGKTLTSILTIAQFIQSGRCKRPILVVPKPTYYKWIGEIHGIIDENDFLTHQGILPQYKINSFYNFGTDILRNEEINVEDNSITIITYQGAKALGFSDDYNSEFQDKIELILDQDDIGNITERERQKRLQNVKEEISKGKLDSKIMMDEYEWDYLIMDEAHNANKIFMNVKGQMKEDGKRESSRYSFANGSGQPSLLGKKMFFLSQYVQQMSNGLGNVNLLTATPFTNNPLNVYNIFALANFERLKQYGIGNVQKFFDEYVDVTYENVVTSKGGIESKQVIKGWKNKIALQKILFGIINYKSAADSPFVKRPIKFTMPLFNEMVDGQMLPLPKEKQISTILRPTPRQKLNQKEISDWLQIQLSDPNGELQKLAPHLVADIMSCKNTLSPHVYEKIDPTTIDPVEFIESSPKLLAMTTAIKKTNEWFDSRKAARSGQIIYINGGIEYMPILKKYLIEYLGYKTNVIEVGKNKFLDEVEILAGDSITDELKEDVKNGFNDGLIKVVIGSSTIREGIDLQMRTSDLHNLWIDWNPTDYKQLEGRLWRFGNKFDYVRIISYLLSGGSDAFKFQKLEEKTARINDIFDRANKSNILEVTEEDREAVKWALIDDVSIIAKEKTKQEAESLRKEIKVNKEIIEKYRSFDRLIERNKDLEELLQKSLDIYIENADKINLPELKTNIDLLAKIRLIKLNEKKIKELNVISNYSQIDFDGYYFSSRYREYTTNVKQIMSLNEKTLKEKGVSVFDLETNVLIAELEQKNLLIQEQITELTSEENIARISSELQAEKEKVDGDALTPEKVAERIASLNDTVLKVLSAETIIKTIENPENSKQKIEVVNQTAIPINEPKRKKEKSSGSEIKVEENIPEPIQLVSYDEIPLSDQLKAVTGESFTDNYKLEGNIYTHLPTGKRFKVPVDKQKSDSLKEIEEAIEALELTLEFTDNKLQAESIKEAIEALKITLELL